MSKRSFTEGLDALIPIQGEKKKRGRPASPDRKEVAKSSQEGTKEGQVRATFIVREELLGKLKAIAYWDRAMIKAVVDAVLQDGIDMYEKKNGAVKPIPKK